MTLGCAALEPASFWGVGSVFINGFHKTKHFSTLCVGKLLSRLLTETVLDSMYHSLNIRLLSYDDLSWLQPVVCLRHADGASIYQMLVDGF